eukprot:gnl/Dysnectes_brevis/618_a685_4926.p1 GENE.gnl/Dysnectes_brevis/618_a685_4926~~gnl/Dysnectes_brevis/618_a685_4926.p1  ORF type:complete len:263 (+),score=103.22 gnl/Dysnectes_brevis/618_a685_4926:37-789(+)
MADILDFSDSDSGLNFDASDGEESLEDWEKEAKKQEEAEAKKAEVAKKQAELQEAEKYRKSLRNRSRETFKDEDPAIQGTEMTDRLAARRREMASLEAAKGFIGDLGDFSDSSSEDVSDGAQRDRTIEDDFMGGGVTVEKVVPTTIEETNPVSAEDFDRLGDMIVAKLKSTLKRDGRSDNDILYLSCLKIILTGALEPMFPEDAKEMSAVASRISSEKYREEAAKKKKGKKKGKKKPRVNIGRSDDYDFM